MTAIGEIRYTVEWLTDVPVVDGDSVIDDGKQNRKYFSKESEAIEFARSVFDKDHYGCARIEKQECQIDEDILQHEGRRQKVWVCLKYCHVSGIDESEEWEDRRY